jgi:hypothetical protein
LLAVEEPAIWKEEEKDVRPWCWIWMAAH